MRDCANCFHRKPVLKEDGTWTAECEKWDCEFQSRENMVEKTEAKQGDLISREALLKEVRENKELYESERIYLEGLLLNAPTVEYTFEEAFQKTVCENKLYCPARPQGEYTEKDMKQAIKENFDLGYEMAKNKYERPQGEWITRHKLNSFGQDVVCFECNKCGEYKVPLYHLLITEPLKVCPNCGADMRKGGAE